MEGPNIRASVTLLNKPHSHTTQPNTSNNIDTDTDTVLDMDTDTDTNSELELLGIIPRTINKMFTIIHSPAHKYV